VAIHRRKERIRLPDRAESREASFDFESLDFKALNRPLGAYYVEFRPIPADRAREHAHPGVELIYVVSGALRLKVAGEEYGLESGDSIYFDASRPHAYRRTGKARCAAVVVTVPRSDGVVPPVAPGSSPLPGPGTAAGRGRSLAGSASQARR
jgi:quercetin dioxygenase-like cupin family protein